MRPSVSRSETSLKGASAVLDAAARVFARQGYDRTSIDDIADELGSTKGRVYHYFRTKSDILLAVQTAGARRLVEGARTIIDDTSLGPAEKLFRMANTHAAAMMADHAFQSVSLRTLQSRSGPIGAREDPDWEKVLELRREYESLYAAVLDEGSTAGAFDVDDTRLAMRGILGALNWITVWFDPYASTGAGRRTQAQIADSMATFVVAGVTVGHSMIRMSDNG